MFRLSISVLLSTSFFFSCQSEPGGNNIYQGGQDLADDVSVSCSESNSDFFTRAVWPTLSTTCLGCHVASSSNASALSYPNDASDAYSSVSRYITSNGKRFANKPAANGVSHGGGRVLTLESSELAALVEMVVRIENPVTSCSSEDDSSARESGYRDVTNISTQRTLRKAAILLQGRMPTANEVTSAQNETGLAQVLAQYMQGEVFDEWLKNSANDHLLTRKYFTGQTEAQEALSADTYNYSRLYQRTSAAFDAAESAETQCAEAGGDAVQNSALAECREAWTLRQQASITYRETQRAIAEEPLELIRYVVNNDRPYSEVLTADYVMMNPFTYEVLDGESWSGTFDAMDASDWRPGHIRHYQINWAETLQSKTGRAYLPAAGILSSPVFLLRYPSTDTNRNRARARWTYYYFLGVDIERLAVRAMDAEELKTVTNPGAAGTSCVGCHQLLDPVAGAFQSWGNASQFLVRNGDDSLPQVYVDSHADYHQGDQWYRGQLAPGFNGNAMPADFSYGPNSSHDDGLQWLAEQLVSDPRFATGTAKFWFKGVFGRDPLLLPTATEDADYSALLAAYQDEQALINDWADRFSSADFNLKTLLSAMIMSPLFRAESIATNSASRRSALNELGLGRLLSPEQLQRKLTATTGFIWRAPWQDESQLLTNYYMFYGGIDSDGISARPALLNSLMYSVVERMANEVACQLVVQEFWPGMARTLFPDVEITTDPSTPAGEAAIRRTIDNLLWRLWGVRDQAEQDALWSLYYNHYQQRLSWSEAANFLNHDDSNDEHDEFCLFADYDDSDGIDIALDWVGISDWRDTEHIREHIGSNYNPEQTLRPWVLVLTALLTDIQFVTE